MRFAAALAVVLSALPAAAGFVAFESGHVRPLASRPTARACSR